MALTYDSPSTVGDVEDALGTGGLDQDTIDDILESAGVDPNDPTQQVVVAKITINADGTTTVIVPEGQTPGVVVVDATQAPAGAEYNPPAGYENIPSVVFDSESNITWVINASSSSSAAQADGAAFDRTIVSGSGNDNISVQNGEDVSLDGRQGNDQLTTSGGNDSVKGGEGNDSISSGAGNDTVSGGDGNDSINAGEGNDSISGGAGSDSIYGSAGVDSIDGGMGYDYMKLDANRSDLQIGSDAITVSGGTTISDVNFIEFANGDTMTVSQDEYFAAGMRLYETILGRSAAFEGAKYWTEVYDNGQDLFTLAWSMIVSDEFQQKHGELTDEQFVSLMFNNALGRDPAQDGLEYWTSLLQDGEKTRYEVATWITLTEEAVEHHQDSVVEIEDWV